MDLHTTVRFAFALASASALSLAASIAAFSLACLSASSCVPAQAAPCPVTDSVTVVPFSHLTKAERITFAVAQTCGGVGGGLVEDGHVRQSFVVSQALMAIPAITNRHTANNLTNIFLIAAPLSFVKVHLTQILPQNEGDLGPYFYDIRDYK